MDGVVVAHENLLTGYDVLRGHDAHDEAEPATISKADVNAKLSKYQELQRPNALSHLQYIFIPFSSCREALEYNFGRP